MNTTGIPAHKIRTGDTIIDQKVPILIRTVELCTADRGHVHLNSVCYYGHAMVTLKGSR